MKEIKLADASAEFRFFGGDLMEEVGGELVKHYREMAFMGYFDVIMNIKTIKRNIDFCRKDVLQFNPDVLVLIDYPGFNLRIAEFAKEHNIRVFYYISPKFWAWKEKRVKKVRAFVDEMFTIFPFETAFYKKHGIDVHYVGNPLMDSLQVYKRKAVSESEFRKKNNLNERPIIAILAGSRIKEVKRILPVMLKSLEQTDTYQYIIAGVENFDRKVYSNIIENCDVKIIYNQTYDLLNNAHTAVVASGTATLETALFKVPQLVMYRLEGGRVIDFIMRNFVMKTKWASLPNIILQKTAVAEYIQKDMTVKKVKPELKRLLDDKDYRKSILNDYDKLLERMGEEGCSKRAAEKMVNLLSLNSEL